MTFLEESLLKQAQDEVLKREKEADEDTEVERIAELRRKGRGKGTIIAYLRTVVTFFFKLPEIALKVSHLSTPIHKGSFVFRCILLKLLLIII